MKNFKSFEQILLLPENTGHNSNKYRDNGVDIENEWSGKLKSLYNNQNLNIISVGNRINDLISRGFYMTIKYKNTFLIEKNEPCVVFGVTKNREISIGGNNGIHIDEDSLVVYIKSDNSLLILSVYDDYDIKLIKPKIIISENDPWGEEDWNEDNLTPVLD